MKKLLIMLFILVLSWVIWAMPAMAIDINKNLKLGGSLRFEASYLIDDENHSSTGEDLTSINRFAMNITELHLNYLSDDKKQEGYAEFGLLSASQGASTGPYTHNNLYSRYLYFKYNFDGGNILFGQTDSLASSWYGPSSVLNDWSGINGFGRDWLDRNEQIRLTLGKKNQIKLALVAPVKTVNIGASTSIRKYPAIEAAIDYKHDNITIYPYLRWERGTLNVTATGKDVGWNSIDTGIDMVADYDFYKVKLGVSYGLNSAGLYSVGGTSNPIFDSNFSNRADHEQLRFFGDLQLGDCHIGGGYAKASREDLNGVDQWAGSPSTAALYANYWITLGEEQSRKTSPFGKITIVPEIAWLDFGETTSGVDQGNGFRLGLYAQLLF